MIITQSSTMRRLFQYPKLSADYSSIMCGLFYGLEMSAHRSSTMRGLFQGQKVSADYSTIMCGLFQGLEMSTHWSSTMRGPFQGQKMSTHQSSTMCRLFWTLKSLYLLILVIAPHKTGCGLPLPCGKTGLYSFWSGCLKIHNSKNQSQSSCLQKKLKDRTGLDF